jgi:hypothetical protein
MRKSDGFINLTKMCKRSGKDFSGYYRNKQTQEFLSELESVLQIHRTKLIEKNNSGKCSIQDTFAHNRVAIHCAQWCSPKMAVYVTEIFERYITGKITTEESKNISKKLENIINDKDKIIEQKDNIIKQSSKLIEQNGELINKYETLVNINHLDIFDEFFIECLEVDDNTVPETLNSIYEVFKKFCKKHKYSIVKKYDLREFVVSKVGIMVRKIIDDCLCVGYPIKIKKSN